MKHILNSYFHVSHIYGLVKTGTGQEFILQSAPSHKPRFCELESLFTEFHRVTKNYFYFVELGDLCKCKATYYSYY